MLKGLPRRQALEIGNTRFHEDVNQLIKHLEKTISGLKAEETLWPPPVLRNIYGKKRHWLLGVGGAVAVLIAGYMLLPWGRTPPDERPAIEDEVKILEESGPPADTSPVGPVEQQIGKSSKDPTAPRDSQQQELNRKDPQRPASKPAAAKVGEKPEKPQNALLQNQGDGKTTQSSPPLPLESSLRKDPNESYFQQPARGIEPATMADPKGVSPAPTRYQEPNRRNDVEAPENRGEQDQIQSGEHTEQARTLAEKAEADYVAIQRLAIRRLLQRFTEAYEQRDASEVKALWPTLSSDKFKSISASFKQARSISFDLQPVSYLPVEQDEVKLTCKRSMQTVLKDGKRVKPVEDELTIELRKREGSWVIENVIGEGPDR